MDYKLRWKIIIKGEDMKEETIHIYAKYDAEVLQVS